MNRPEEQQWRNRVAFVAPPNIAGGVSVDDDHFQSDLVEVANLMRRKKRSCVVPRVLSAECKLDERMIDVRRFEAMGTFLRRVVPSSAPVSIAKLVPASP
jgi:hypothetical protein